MVMVTLMATAAPEITMSVSESLAQQLKGSLGAQVTVNVLQVMAVLSNT